MNSNEKAKTMNTMIWTIWCVLLCLMLEAGWPVWTAHLVLFEVRFIFCFVRFVTDKECCSDKEDWIFGLIMAIILGLVGMVDQLIVLWLHSLIGAYAAVVWPWALYGIVELSDRIENKPLFEKEEEVRIHDETDSLDHPAQTVPAEDAGPDINGGEQEQDP